MEIPGARIIGFPRGRSIDAILAAFPGPFIFNLGGWIEWAAKEKVSETVAAALLLICETRPAHEVMAKLAPGEFEQVADLVSRWPGQFPPATLAAVKSRRQTPSPDPPAVTSRPISRADRSIDAFKLGAATRFCVWF